MITKDMIAECHGLDIKAVALRLGLQVERGGRVLCVFHDDHRPSMSLRGGYFRCWSCGAKGDSISLVRKVLGLDFAQAVEWLLGYSSGTAKPSAKPMASEPKVEASPLVPNLSDYQYLFQNPILTSEARYFLFDQRRLKHEVIFAQRITSNHDYLIIPYFGMDGTTLLNIQWRYLGADRDVPRFLFTKGCKPQIYNLPVLAHLQVDEPLYISEGISDCLAMLSCGFKAVAVPSATLLRSSSGYELLRKHRNVYMCPDNDVPGLALFAEIKGLCPSATRIYLPKTFKDFGEMYMKLNSN